MAEERSPGSRGSRRAGSTAAHGSAARREVAHFAGLSRQALDALRVPIAYIDRRRRVRFATDAFAAKLGLPVDRVTGRGVRAVLDDGEYAVLGDALAHAFDGEAATVEWERAGAAGGRRWIRAQFFPDRHGDEVWGALWLWIDVTAVKRLEAEAIERERRLRLFTDHIPGPIVYLDAGLRFAFVNRSWCEWTGLTADETLGKPLSEVLTLDLAEFLQPLLARAALGEPIDYERRVDPPAGQPRWVRGRIVPDFDASRTLVGYYLTAHDISDLKTVQDRLASRERQLRAVMDGIPAPVGYVGADEHYRFFNRAFSSYFGFASESARTVTIRELVGDEAYPAAKALFERALAGRAVGYDRPVRRIDGKVRWMNVRVVPDFSSTGSVRGAFVLMTDIDDLKVAEEALAASETQLREIIDHVPSRVTYLDRDLQVRFANRHAQRWFGRDGRELVGLPVARLVTDERMKRAEDLYERVLRGESVFADRLMPQPDGGERWEALHLAPQLDRTGAVVGVYAVVTDIDAARRNEEALRRANWMLSSHIDNTPLAVVEWDADFRLSHWSPQAEKIFGWAAAEVIGLTLDNWRLIHEGDRAGVGAILADLAAGTVPRATSLHRDYRRDGKTIWCEWYNSSLHDASGKLISILSLIQDVSSRIEAEEHLQHLATHDPLTGLPNRVLLNEHLAQAIAVAKRTGRRAAVLFVDLDRFKTVNDSFGHRLGDALLKQIAERLGAALRETDSLARLAGDEFIVVIDRFDEPDVPAGIAVKLLDIIATPVYVEDHEIFVTASIGISMFPDDGASADELLRNADVALYRAKGSGRNAMHFFSPEMAEVEARQHTVEVALRAAVREGGLALRYQPVVRIADRKVIGVEALIRWNHPERGWILPHAFIPPAEESGLIHILGDWVLREACRQAKAWRQAGLPPLTVGVNLSGKQFFREDLAARIERTIVSEGCEPEWIEIEVTETSLLEDLDKIHRVLAQLKAFGIGVAIDDFGTGYSSLSHLRHLPIDKLKIDLTFIAGVTTDSGDAAITEAIISLGRGLDLAVVAEGVETIEQLEFLRARGCGYAQGALFGGALEPDEVAALLAVPVADRA